MQSKQKRKNKAPRKARSSTVTENSTSLRSEKAKARGPKKCKPNKSISGPVVKAATNVARLPMAEHRLPERIGVLLNTMPDEDYALLDSGDGQKLERYGSLTIIRPEAQAMWQKRLPNEQWEKADAIFTGDTDEEGLGRWFFPKEQLAETFPMKWDGIAFHGRFTSFRHTGVFPEQAAHWHFAADQIKSSPLGKQPRILNLFGYTGIASLAAARAGAHVTHVDASRKAIGWAKENQQLAGFEDKPIRWICDDAVKFCEREVRRGNKYEGILLDPPAYGRGPKGEVWHLFEQLPHLLDLCRELMSEQPLFTVLTAYTIRTSFLAMHELMQEVYGDMGGGLESGELTISTKNDDRRISTSMFSRWTANEIEGLSP